MLGDNVHNAYEHYNRQLKNGYRLLRLNGLSRPGPNQNIKSITCLKYIAIMQFYQYSRSHP